MESEKFVKASDVKEYFKRAILGADQKVDKWVDAIPAADVRPVVTCEECAWHVDDGDHYCNKWCQPCPDNAEFFCAYGERPNCGAEMKTKQNNNGEE